MRFALSAVIAIFWSLPIWVGALPAWAGETPWQQIVPDVRMRMISADQPAGAGFTLAALEIDMPQTYKTYWVVPGQTGIATTMRIDGSRGVVGHDMIWPYPRIDTGSGYLDYVYDGPTVLPVRLEITGDDLSLEAEVNLGICSDICMPASARFSLPIDLSRPDRVQGLRIRQAMALAPEPWIQANNAQTPFGPVRRDPDGTGLLVQLGDAGVDPASLILRLEIGDAVFGVPQKSPEPDIVRVPLLGPIADNDLEGHSVQLTFTTPEGSFEIFRRIEPATAGLKH